MEKSWFYAEQSSFGNCSQISIEFVMIYVCHNSKQLLHALSRSQLLIVNDRQGQNWYRPIPNIRPLWPNTSAEYSADNCLIFREFGAKFVKFSPKNISQWLVTTLVSYAIKMSQFDCKVGAICNSNIFFEKKYLFTVFENINSLKKRSPFKRMMLYETFG